MYGYYPYVYMLPRASYSITVNRSSKTLHLYKNGSRIKTYTVAVGKPATPTPKGSFTIINKENNPGGVFGSGWLGFNIPGYGIHGTNNPSSIGKAVSHGCVRMFNKDIKELYQFTLIGTNVTVI